MIYTLPVLFIRWVVCVKFGGMELFISFVI